MKVLHLTLKKKWFDLIASGVKKEEYREIKPYWKNRLGRMYDAIEFSNGYGAAVPKMLVVWEGVHKGLGRESWGAERDKEYYVLLLGKVISISNAPKAEG